MREMIEWVFNRAALDPDAASCAIIVGIILVVMILTVVVYFGSVFVWNLIRMFRGKNNKQMDESHLQNKAA